MEGVGFRPLVWLCGFGEVFSPLLYFSTEREACLFAY